MWSSKHGAHKKLRYQAIVIEFRKAKGEINPADLFTKHFPSGQKIVDPLALVNCYSSIGRPSSAPTLKPIRPPLLQRQSLVFIHCRHELTVSLLLVAPQ